MVDDKNQSIAGLLQRTASKRDELESRPFVYDGELELRFAEISLLNFIAEHSRESVTYIASALHITKGAVSQTLRKLELKGLVEKLQDPLNASKISISMSFKGRIIVQKLQSRQHSNNDALDNPIRAMNQKELEVIQNFLIQYEKSLDRRI